MQKPSRKPKKQPDTQRPPEAAKKTTFLAPPPEGLAERSIWAVIISGALYPFTHGPQTIFGLILTCAVGVVIGSAIAYLIF